MNDVTTKDVRDVLRHLARDRTPRASPLAATEVVRRQLAAAGYLPTPQACLSEVGHVLARVVESELRAHRLRNGAPGTAAQPADGPERVLTDFRRGDLELEAWSAVYHVFLRPDLQLDIRALERLLGDRHRRTIQRRLKTGTERLATRLQDLEREARAASRRERLRARLPSGAPDRIVGAEGILRTTRKRLDHGHRLVALGGPPGIGKTAVALEIARAAARLTPHAEPIWLTPAEVDASARRGRGLAAEIADRCGLPGLDSGRVREALAPQRRVVIVDGLDTIGAAARVAAAAVRLTDAFAVLLTGRVCWSGVTGVHALTVPPLDLHSALRLRRREAAVRGLAAAARATADELLPLAAAADGHPLVLRAAAGELRHSDGSGVARSVLEASGALGAVIEQLWSDQWWSVDEPARLAAELVIGAEVSGAPTERIGLADAWRGEERLLDEALRSAVDAGLLVQSGTVRRPRYRSAPFLGRFVRRLTGPPAGTVPAAPTVPSSADRS
jgi:hypothetical protein